MRPWIFFFRCESTRTRAYLMVIASHLLWRTEELWEGLRAGGVAHNFYPIITSAPYQLVFDTLWRSLYVAVSRLLNLARQKPRQRMLTFCFSIQSDFFPLAKSVPHPSIGFRESFSWKTFYPNFWVLLNVCMTGCFTFFNQKCLSSNNVLLGCRAWSSTSGCHQQTEGTFFHCRKI